MQKVKTGFTLIELLVVVLIIGVLTAIALPQYNIAVIKSRTATMLPILKNLAEAQEVYYMNNGRYAGKISELDIQLPNSCSHVDHASYDSSERGELIKCDEFFLIDNDGNGMSINANYCPQNNTSWSTCSPNRDFQIAFRLAHRDSLYSGEGNKRYCAVYNQKLGKQICSAFGGLEYKN
ncbi:MAG: prepilin-type N-terminal cleavage/methylation domain-containing protein [Elusimicrobiaceae bacterium]|nr:prepilin-type N-terminal cleavage/methylation domain-containing protein [Elusimicrobiaceae bacterium]